MALRYANRPREVCNVFVTSLLTWGSRPESRRSTHSFLCWTSSVDSNGGFEATASSGRRSFEIRRGICAETVVGFAACARRRRSSCLSATARRAVSPRAFPRISREDGDAPAVARGRRGRHQPREAAQVCLNIPSRHLDGHSTTCSTVARNTSHGIILVYDVALIICVSPS